MDLQLKANKLKADYVSLRYARNAIKVVNNLRSKNNKYKFALSSDSHTCLKK